MQIFKPVMEECLICCEELDDANMVFYKESENATWMTSPYCKNCIQDNFIGLQWEQYLQHLQEAYITYQY